MTCQNYKDLMMGFLDEELDSEQIEQFQAHIKQCPSCSEELEEFRKLKSITDEINLVEPEDRIWKQYWTNTYNRIERGIGWIIFSVAAILLIIYGGFKVIEEMLSDPQVETIFKIALVALVVGCAILFVSVLRERLHFWKRDRYKDVRR
jgi:hypothetical protein